MTSRTHPDPHGGAADVRLMALNDLAADLRRVCLAIVETEVETVKIEQAREVLRELAPILEATRRGDHEPSSVFARRGGQRAFSLARGSASPLSPPVRFEVGDCQVITTVSLDRRYEGPVGYLHGGMAAVLLDEALGLAVETFSTWGLTAALNLRYSRPVPLRQPVEIWACVDKVRGRATMARGGIRPIGSHSDYVFANSTFVTPTRATQESYFGTVLDHSSRGF